MNAEVWWVLQHVVSGYSDNSVTGSVNLFQSMFPVSKIARTMELGKDKLKYVVNYGIALTSAKWPSSTARRRQILRDGFDSRLEPIAMDIFNGWLLTRRAQAHFAVSLNYR